CWRWSSRLAPMTTLRCSSVDSCTAQWVRRALGAMLVSLAIGVDTSARAAPPRSDAATGPAAEPTLVGRASALGQVAARVAADLGPAAKEAWVFLSPLHTDETAPRADELLARLATLIAGPLGGVPHAEPVTAATAHALAHRAKALVYAEVEIGAGQLR